MRDNSQVDSNQFINPKAALLLFRPYHAKLTKNGMAIGTVYPHCHGYASTVTKCNLLT